MVHRVHLSLHFGKLFLDLVPHLARLFPVETGVGGFFLHPESFYHSGQRRRNTGKDSAITPFFFKFNLLPIMLNLRRIFHISVAKHVRVPEYQFIIQFIGDIGNVKRVLLLTYLGIEQHVEQHIAKLLTDILIISGKQSIT